MVPSHVFYHCKDLHQAVKSKTSGGNKKAKVLWALKEAKGKGVDECDVKHQNEIQTRAQFRLTLWSIHPERPAAALAKAYAWKRVRAHHL